MSCGQAYPSLVSEAPHLCRAPSPAEPSNSSSASSNRGRDGSLLTDLDRDMTLRSWPGTRRVSEVQVRKNSLPDVLSARRSSDAQLHMSRIDEPLSGTSKSQQILEAEKHEHIRNLRLLSLQAGLQFKDAHDFSTTMVGNSVGDTRRSSRIMSRRPSLAPSPVPEMRPTVDDPLAALMQQMGASQFDETPTREAGARRPSRVLLSQSAMSHCSDDKRPATSTSTVIPASSMMTNSCRSSPSPVPALHKGVLALLSRRPEDGRNNSQLKEEKASPPGDLSWRKWQKDIAESHVGAKTPREAEGGAKASYIILSNIGLEVFNPSKLPR